MQSYYSLHKVPVASLVDYYTIMGLINELNTINYNNFVSF